MDPPKVSFGFSKLSKKTKIISNKIVQDENKVELIECLEGKLIKVKDAVVEVKQPLIIPLKDNKKNLLDRIRESKKQSQAQDSLPEDTRPISELTPDELVARQLIREAKQRLTNDFPSDNTKVTVLPLNKDTPSLEGEKEPTLEDYDSVPISDYGMAILRGMGWKEGMPIGKNTTKFATINVPKLRPKGLGLGAAKIVKSHMPSKKPTDKHGNELVLKQGAFARVIDGQQSGNYCEVQGFDEEAGRVIIKVYPKGEIVNINELMLTLVTKEEFCGAKYGQYKEMSDKHLENYKIKLETSGSKYIRKKEQNGHSESEDDGDSRNRRKSSNRSTKVSKRSESPDMRRESSSKRSSHREKSPSRHWKKDSSKTYQKEKRKKNRRSRSKSMKRNRGNSSKYTSKSISRRRMSSSNSSSDENRRRERRNKS